MTAAAALQERIAQALSQGLGEHIVARPYQLDSAFIPWSHQPALLEDYARNRELDIDHWLAHAGARRGQALSPRQLLALLDPLQHAARDSAFVLGQLALPGHYGLASHALQGAPDLLQALRLLCRFSARLSPLLTPRLLIHEDELLLYWTEACGLPTAQRNHLVDMQMSAVTAMAQWLGTEALPWRYSFNRTQPADLSQHAAYLGPRLQFNCHIDGMRLALGPARRPWPGRQPAGIAAAALAAQADPPALQRGLRAALYDSMMARAPALPTLDESAAQFGVSAATLKRHLAQQGTHYQAELDTVRAHLALFLLALDGHSNETVATALGFHDTSNFRRSFKRWTGLTPGAISSSPSMLGI
ncbi:helix-turn-helix domain-containing protein [Paucibacter sp. APW11]|uniref:Helix-turn-helix domain-containing protein n=1 Tax=Roseateles aquae TaxID=3077235 RepID=A0ABU3PEN9_9BURK|nr:helix-turn-helix domain-containing protein [Paucibacter sp. APW11]MDT9001038.1 helix-turn-helix domain-containing protein [Paucibacter sp. APW11]